MSLRPLKMSVQGVQDEQLGIIHTAHTAPELSTHLTFPGTHICTHPEIRVTGCHGTEKSERKKERKKANGKKLPSFHFYALSSYKKIKFKKSS